VLVECRVEILGETAAELSLSGYGFESISEVLGAGSIGSAGQRWQCANSVEPVKDTLSAGFQSRKPIH
jgi:hypothetical protein